MPERDPGMSPEELEALSRRFESSDQNTQETGSEVGDIIDQLKTTIVPEAEPVSGAEAEPEDDAERRARELPAHDQASGPQAIVVEGEPVESVRRHWPSEDQLARAVDAEFEEVGAQGPEQEHGFDPEKWNVYREKTGALITEARRNLLAAHKGKQMPSEAKKNLRDLLVASSLLKDEPADAAEAQALKKKIEGRAASINPEALESITSLSLS